MRLSEMLELEPVRRARPRWAVPPAADHEVGWVHSSEIAEIAPLLQGGEVLLTTGLGLVGADAGGFDRYVAGLAARGVTALALELGRTFAEPPPELVDPCRRHDLPLLTFAAVVPFVQTCRAANEAVLEHEATGLRRQQRVTATLTSALLEGAGLPALVDRLADLTGTAVDLVARDGHVVARSRGGGELGADHVHEPVHLFARPWGHLRAAVDDHDRREIAAALARAVVAVELALLRTVEGQRRHGDARRALLIDLVRGNYADADEVTSRAAGVGLPTGHALLPVALTADPSTASAGLRRAVNAALETSPPRGIAGEVDEVVVAVLVAPTRSRAALKELADAVAMALARTGGRLHRLVADEPVARPVQLTAGLRAAIDGALSADRLGSDQRVLLPADLALLHTLRAAGDEACGHLVRTVLGPLLAHDARHRPALTPTLEAYLDSGRSKALAAERLGVRRQTVHARISRVGELLDLDPDGPADATTLHLAITAWRARRAGGA
jgi:purine catabolism regulator